MSLYRTIGASLSAALGFVLSRRRRDGGGTGSGSDLAGPSYIQPDGLTIYFQPDGVSTYYQP